MRQLKFLTSVTLAVDSCKSVSVVVISSVVTVSPVIAPPLVGHIESSDDVLCTDTVDDAVAFIKSGTKDMHVSLLA